MIWIVTDTGQEHKTDRENGLVVLDCPILVNGEHPEEKLDAASFYALLDEEGISVTTSQVSPAEYMDVFEELTKNPEDEVVCITIGSRLSGTCNSARLASQGNERIHLVDSNTVCLQETMLVDEAIRLRKEGKSAAEIAAILDEEKKNIRILAYIPVLKYLKKGGRISPAKAAIGDLAGIKPIITIEDGEVAVAAKCRGMKKAMRTLMDQAKAYDIDLSRPVSFGYTGTDDATAKAMIEEFEKSMGQKAEHTPVPLTFLIGVHVGPEGAGFGFFTKDLK